ncbi:MAG: AraC family ligand binding domain-containing protein [Bacteroidota bacterium]
MPEQEKAKFWRDTTLGELELLRAQYVTHAFAPHIHEGYAIGVIEAGAEGFLYRGAYHVAPAGTMVALNPGERHTGEAAARSGWTYRMLYPEARLLQQAAAEVAGRSRAMPFFGRCVIRDELVAQWLLNLHAALEEGVSVLERESRLLWVLAHLVSRHADDRPSPPALRPERESVRRAREYIEQCYAGNILLEDLARAANHSPFHLLRVFRREVGLPPHAYLTLVRVRQAKRLLAEGRPILEVAAQTGFSDQSHLTRHFKRLVGVTPGQFAAASHPRG